MDEKELEKVSGGVETEQFMTHLYRCPNCGYEARMANIRIPVLCLKCRMGHMVKVEGTGKVKEL